MSKPISPDDLMAPASVGRLERRARMIGLGALALCVVGGFLSPERFFQSYLIAYLFWLGIAMGCFALSMLHQLSGGAWGIVIRRTLEAAARTLPWVAVGFVPLLFGLESVYPWADAAHVAEDYVLKHKAPYLNVPFFVGRTVFYFGLWVALATVFARWSARQDRGPDSALSERMQKLSAGGLAAYCLTGTFASVDWLMSVDPHWYSSLYGVYFIGGQALSGLAFIIPVTLFLSRDEPMSRIVRRRHYHDHGKLMLAFVMLWAYFSISQFLIIWSGDIPEEVPWYIERLQGGWQWWALSLVLLHFALPFLLLLSVDLKRDGRRLAVVALIVLAMRWVDLYWQAAPVYSHGHLALHWLDLALPVALGGLWVSLFAGQLRRRALVPVHAPGAEEVLSHV